MERYGGGAKIREGNYATDYLAWDPVTQQTVTLRKIPLMDMDFVHEIIIECVMLHEACHPNIISLKRIFYDEGHIILVLEGIISDLRACMTYWPEKFQDQKKIKIYLKDLLCGIAYCHSLEVFHRDLKPETILIDATGALKLGDLGTARVFPNSNVKLTPQVYTLQYRAPEILLGSEDYTAAIDIWSIGCIFFEMLVAKKQQERKLFDGKSEIDMLQDIFSKLGTPDEQTWPGVSSLPGFAFEFPKIPPQVI
ncbi:hypothetical protein SO802_030109 [Lithocarpus litseifolius]|uniref:cyclin-dependent kinase n=1 Tax=Lithocarpus litseifolius TaxID=425828 RepID=A0AAW2BV19_9ROSI